MPDTARDDFGHRLAKASILLVDAEPGIRDFLARTLAPRCERVEQAASTAEATRWLDAAPFDLVIVDNAMPGKSGLDWLREQRDRGLSCDTILIAADADLDTAIAALRARVGDLVVKPFRANQILGAVERALDRKDTHGDNALPPRARHERGGRGQLLGSSPQIAAVREVIGRVAQLPTPVLFSGASGTGKEVAARHLHEISDRAGAPFVAVNCATIAADRSAQELFGEVEPDGRLKPGVVLLADGGTLLLDEVAQMPAPVQAALLRVIEDRKVRPVGAEREIPLDVRFLFATNADLDQAVRDGHFRSDLFHRINVLHIEMPPLADRSEDIVELAAHFMGAFPAALRMPALELDDTTLLKMRRHDWPGNVRELRNLIERSVILGALPEEFSGGGAVAGTEAVENLDLVVQRHILHVLDSCGGNRAEAARRLGVSRKTIDRKLAAWRQ